ncbi:protein of unknown function (plasmid) [Caballeronia sp. S22]
MTQRIKLSESQTDLVATGQLLPLRSLGDGAEHTRGMPQVQWTRLNLTEVGFSC